MIYDLGFEGDYLPCRIGSGDPLTPSINRSPVIPSSYHFRFSWLLCLIQRTNGAHLSVGWHVFVSDHHQGSDIYAINMLVTMACIYV